MHIPKLPPELITLARNISSKCTRCLACQIRCAFLKEHGTPGELAERLLASGTGLADQKPRWRRRRRAMAPRVHMP